MTAPDDLYAQARALHSDPQIGECDRAGLSLAISAYETARAALADARQLLECAVLGVARTLETGRALAFHEFSAEHYSKVTTGARAANFRAALARLEQAVATAVAGREAFRATLRKGRAA